MEDIKQGLVELIADFLDSEEVMIAEAINGKTDPEPREITDLHIRMAEAAMEVYKRTVK